MIRKRKLPTFVEKIRLSLETVVYIILLFSPFFIGAVCGIINYVGDWSWLFPEHNHEYYYRAQQIFPDGLVALLLLICVILFITGMVTLADRLGRILSDRHDEKLVNSLYAVSLFIIAVGVRAFLLIVFKGEIHPYSDFERAWERATGDMSSLAYYSFFPGYINYSLFEKGLTLITGANYDAVLWFCALCNGVTCVLLYLIAYEIFHKVGLAFLVGLLYALNPSQIVYTLTSTPEHLAIACFVGSIYFLCRFLGDSSDYGKIVCITAAGILGGIGSSVKTFFPIIVIAFTITLIIRQLLWTCFRKVEFKRICLSCVCIVMLFTVQRAVTYGITATSEKVFDVKLNYSDATPHYFNVGLNRQGEGQIHIGRLSRLYIQDRNNGVPLEEAKARAIERITEDWKTHLDEIPDFFMQKTIWAWQDDYVPISYFLNQLGLECNTKLETFIYNAVAGIGASYSQIWYILSMLLGVIGTIFLYCKRRKEYRNMKFLLTNLLILGYFCITLISESQSRYKCLCIPYICIMDAYTVTMMSESICKLKVNLRKNP